MNSRLRLSPVSEEPIDADDVSTCPRNKKLAWMRKWLVNRFPILFHNKSHLRILLSVVACPLFPLSVIPYTISHVSSSAQYIIQHFTAATGCNRKLVKNMYATGKVTMSIVDQDGPNAAAVAQKGCFVMWQMVPDKWLIELVVGGHKVVAGCDGNVAWRHTPWLGAHAAKGAGVRPLRRSLQGLDPVAISSAFSTAEYMGEKQISSVECFVLKLSAEQADLAERSDTTAEMIKHVVLGYFSQRSGFLVYLEDSYLTRIQQQAPGSLPTYWETIMFTEIDDYRRVEPGNGMMIAHSGKSSVMITRVGDNMRMITRMEETYEIDDVAFNVAGLSIDNFIPPKEMHKADYPEESLDWMSPNNLHR